MLVRFKQILVSLPFRIIVIIWVTYLIFGFFLVNPLAKKILPWVGKKQLGSELSVKKIFFNPLTLETTVYGFKLAQISGQPLASFDRLYVNLAFPNLLRFAWHIKTIELDGAQIELLLPKGGKFNWAELIQQLNANKKTSSNTLPRLLIDHIKIDRSEVCYIDANRHTAPFKASLYPLDIMLEGLSTLPQDRGRYKIVARLPEQGGTLRWTGDITLNPIQSNGKIRVDGINLSQLFNIVTTSRHYALSSGPLAASLNYRFRLSQDKPWLQIDDGRVLVQNFSLAADHSGVPVIALKEIRVQNADLDLAARTASISMISLTGGNLTAIRRLDGSLDWQTLFAPNPEPIMPITAVRKQNSLPAAADWKLTVNQLTLNDWHAQLTDRTYIHPLRIAANHFYLAAALHGLIGSRPALLISPITASSGPLQVFSGSDQTPVAQLNKANLDHGVFNLAADTLDLNTLKLTGIDTVLAVRKGQHTNWQHILAKAAQPAASPSPARVQNSGPSLTMHLSHFTLAAMQLHLRDQSSLVPTKLDIINGHLDLSKVSFDLNRSIPLDLNFAIQQGGRFSLVGSIIPNQLSGVVKLDLANLSLKPFAPYINHFARLTLNEGMVSTSGKVVFALHQKTNNLNYAGGFAINHMDIREEDTGDAFLNWDKLSSQQLSFKLGPDSLNIGELVAMKSYAKIIIFADKSLNLNRIQRNYKPAPAHTASATGLADSAPETTLPGGIAGQTKITQMPAQFPVTIERLRIVNGAAEYADLSLPTKFGTRIHDINGVVTGLSTDFNTIAQVELDGVVDPYGSARIRGSLQPFYASNFTDLSLSFKNLEMANLTPYSGKFAGRDIKSGILSADLQYKIKQQQLAGDNQFVINQLRLGARVDSKDAFHVPLDLAIALLQDSNGIIHLNLPVSGNLDDPQFSYTSIIWKAFVNVLTKLGTEPFQALGHLFGTSSATPAVVNFDFGSAQLNPPEREKLNHLAQALSKRPTLQLIVQPDYQTLGDTRALQVLQIRQSIAAQMGLPVSPGENPGLVDTSDPKTQQALAYLYQHRFKNQRKLNRHQNPDAIYTDMLEQLTVQIPVPQHALQKLAAQRGLAIQQELIAVGKLDPQRLTIRAAVADDSGGITIASKMSLQVNSPTGS